MQITREELNPCTIQIKVAVGEQAVRDGFDRAFKKLTKSIKMPGFRPGHAPKAMLEQMVHPEALYETAADLIVRDAFPKALESEKLEPHSQPSVEITSVDKDNSKLEFVAKIPLAPKVELGDYKGLAAERPAIEITDAEVNAQIDELRKSQSKQAAVTERGILEGDVAVVNIKVEGEEGDGKNFMVIAGQTFPDMDAALMGMKSDEIKGLDVTFPENFQEKSWAGKLYHIQLSVRSISAVQLPELEDVAKSLEMSSAEDLKATMRTAIERAKSSMADDYVNEQLLENLLGASTVHVPDTMWEQVANRRLNDLAQEQAQKNKSLEQYAEENGMTIGELVEAWQHEAKLHVQRAVIVQRIFELEGMQLSNADLNNELVVMAREYNADPRELLEAMKKQNALQELQFRAVFRKVTDFLRENASITAGSSDPAPKAKSAAKSAAKPAAKAESKPKKAKKD